MAEPVIERIADAMVAQLKTIIKGATYRQDAYPVRLNRRGAWKTSARTFMKPKSLMQDGFVVVEQTDRRLPEEAGPDQYATYMQGFDLHLIVRKSDSDIEPVDTYINRFKSDVEKCLIGGFEGSDWGRSIGGFIEIEITGDRQFDPDVSVDGITLSVDVHYRHAYGDPDTGV